MNKHSHFEIATDYALWQTYFDTSGKTSAAEFETLSPMEKLEMIDAHFGYEKAEITGAGRESIKDYFDGIFGSEEQYDLDIGINEVLFSVETCERSGQSVVHEITDPNGRPRSIALYRGTDYTLNTAGPHANEQAVESTLSP